jgi:hypothetical protein
MSRQYAARTDAGEDRGERYHPPHARFQMLAVSGPLAAIDAPAYLALARARRDGVSDSQRLHRPAESCAQNRKIGPTSQEGVEPAHRLELRFEEATVVDRCRNRALLVVLAAINTFQLQGSTWEVEKDMASICNADLAM